jgi:carbon monoxide dehydrogenase subunit G
MAVTVERAVRLERSVGIDAPIKDVWPALLDLERVLACLPGAELTDVDDDGAYHGTLRVNFGPLRAEYHGTLRLDAVNRRTRTAVLAVSSSRQPSRVAIATVIGRSDPGGRGTRLDLVTELPRAGRSLRLGQSLLFAILGTQGQLIALLLFVYLGIASAGGTVPLQALPGPLKLVSQIEPLRQILSGTRSILYFGATGNAGVTRGIIAATAGLIFWVLIGAMVVRWYDRKGLQRLQPDLLAHVQRSVSAYHAQAQQQPQPADQNTRAPEA